MIYSNAFILTKFCSCRTQAEFSIIESDPSIIVIVIRNISSGTTNYMFNFQFGAVFTGDRRERGDNHFLKKIYSSFPLSPVSRETR